MQFMEEYKTKRIHITEIAKDIYAAVTPVNAIDITDAGMMDNFSNAAFINWGEGLVCDTYYDLAHAGELREFCVQKSGHAPGYVINTHGHWDHFWGNQAFSESKIMGHKEMLQDCADDRKKLKAFKVLGNSKILQETMNGILTKTFKNYLEPGQSCKLLVKQSEYDFDLNGIEPMKPQVLFEENRTLDLDGLEVQLLPLGAIHSSSDTVVWIPSEKVLFAGDIFADCSLPTNLSGAKRWIKVMDEILDELQPEVIVPGHGTVYDRARAESQRAYFQSMVEQFETYYTDTIKPKELCNKIDVRQYIDHRPRLGWVMAINGMLKEKRGKK